MKLPLLPVVALCVLPALAHATELTAADIKAEIVGRPHFSRRRRWAASFHRTTTPAGGSMAMARRSASAVWRSPRMWAAGGSTATGSARNSRPGTTASRCASCWPKPGRAGCRGNATMASAAPRASATRSAPNSAYRAFPRADRYSEGPAAFPPSWPGLSRPSTASSRRAETWMPGTSPGMTALEETD